MSFYSGWTLLGWDESRGLTKIHNLLQFPHQPRIEEHGHDSPGGHPDP